MRTIAAGILVSTVAGLSVASVACIWAIARMSAPEPARWVLRIVLQAPIANALEEVIQRQEPGVIRAAVDRDLVAFSIDLRRRPRPDPQTTITRLVLERADQLYLTRIPRDPGPRRTPAIAPRSLINQLNAERHRLHVRSLLIAAPAALLASVGCIVLGGRRLGPLYLTGGLIIAVAVYAVAAWTLRNSITLGTPGGAALRNVITTAGATPLWIVVALAVLAAAAAAVSFTLSQQVATAIGRGYSMPPMSPGRLPPSRRDRISRGSRP